MEWTLERMCARAEGEEKNCTGNKLGLYGHRHQVGKGKEVVGKKDLYFPGFISSHSEKCYIHSWMKKYKYVSSSNSDRRGKNQIILSNPAIFKLSTVTLVKNTDLEGPLAGSVGREWDSWS